jgi:hypothetical protein
MELTTKERAAVQQWADRLDQIGEAVGGWTHKAEARRTGASVHFRFQNETDVETSLAFIELLSTTPQKLNQLAKRVLAATTTEENR